MNKKKITGAAFAVSLLAAAMVFPAQAAVTEKITDITMEIDSDFYIGGTGDSDYVTVSVDNSDCYVHSVTVTNKSQTAEWEEGDKPKLRIVVKAESGYAFDSGLGKDDVALSEDEGTVTSVSRSSSSLTISVTLPKLDENDYGEDMDYSLDVSELIWDQANGTAYWEAAPYAKKYEVRLYRGGSSVSDTLTTTNCYYNLASYFTKSGSYVFKVRGIRTASNKGEWQESDEFYVSTSEAAEIKKNAGSSTVVSGTATAGSGSGSMPMSGADPAGKWIEQKGTGWWWCNPDRSYPRAVWAQIGGRWYYFNDQGYCVMNSWVQTSGKWYYCGPDGAMLVSQMIDGRYYVNANGEWVQ